ncbi:hypothetical protein ACT6QH_02015 [Xanthobacter sp. TB0139]|uniref:hypothetical protein n=1 Tax=Xanthobacter sp. TB0139 TaxID=3459178 RepID=UPI0040394A42
MSDENSDGTVGVDLFGQPTLPIRDRRGRPSFKKDKENQDFVCARVAAGWSHKMIAENMGIDEKTLRKHFSRELQSGLVLTEGVLLDVLMRKAREGHVPSVRLLMERISASVPSAPRVQTSPAEGDEKPSAPVGKKEQRLQDAQSVPEDYGDMYARLRTPH